MGGWPQSYLASIAASPALSAIVPASGGNSGSLTASVTGSGLPAGATVKLTRSGHVDLAGSAIAVAADGLSLSVTFNLAGADTGLWNVVVATPDSQTVSLANGFRITGLSAPALRVSILWDARVSGVPAMRHDWRTEFEVVIDNAGNVDAQAVPLWLTGIPGNATVELDPAVSYPVSGPTEPTWSAANVPGTFTDAALNKYVTLLIPRVPGQGTVRRQFFLTVPGVSNPPFTLKVAVTPPWVDGTVFRSCLTGGGIANGACMGTQLTAINAYLAANPTLSALSGVAVWMKVAWQCVPGGATVPSAQAKAEQVLDYLVAAVETETAGAGCSGVLLPQWRDVVTVTVGGAVDPNDKLGATGTVSGQQALPYTIRFENVGNQPAQNVTVEDPLDADKMDLGTLTLEDITFGTIGHISPTPGQTSWTVNMPAQNLRVEIAAYLDDLTHHLSWYFRSYNLNNGATPPLGVGFLPVNDATHVGEGSVRFNIRPKNPLTGTISNAASILFDVPPATSTVAWLSSVDNMAPRSHVKPFTTPQDPARYKVEWEPVAGPWPDLWDYTIYASEDGGPYWAWRQPRATAATSDTFAARGGHSYRFYSRARDVNNNTESDKTTPEAQMNSPVGVGDPGERRVSLAGARPNPAPGEMEVWFTLASAEAAALEVYDVVGRRVLRRSVGALGPGEHVVRLGESPQLRAGLYFLRLSQGRQVLHARVAVVR